MPITKTLSGIAYTMPATDSDLSIVSKMYAINVLGPMRMVTHFHRMIIEVKGKIVNIGSIGGVTPYVYGSAYNGSKAALVHWGATLRVEMLPFGLGPLILHAQTVLPDIPTSANSKTTDIGYRC